MPDPIVAAQDASPAASSPAPDPTPVVADAFDAMSESDRHAWRMTGKLPGTSPVTDAAAASSTAEPAAQVASTDAVVEAATEAAEPINAKTKARMDALLTDRATERTRADRAERELADLRARSPQPSTDARPAASSAAPAGLVKPDPETFPYGTADPGYLEALTDYKVAVSVEAQRTAWQQDQQQTRAREESHRVITAFEGKAAEARTKHPDFDAVAMLAPTEIPQGSAVDLWILEDEAGAEILYHLQQPANAAERRRILGLGALQQVKALARLGDRLTAAAPAPRTTTAPSPAPVLSTRATPRDDVEQALAMGDSEEGTAKYNAAMNARDLARLKR